MGKPHRAAPAAIGWNVIEYAPPGEVVLTTAQRDDIRRALTRVAKVEAERDAWQRRYKERCGQDLGDVGAAINEAGRASGEAERLRGVIREAVSKLTNLRCMTKRDQSRLCMAFDALYPETQR